MRAMGCERSRAAIGASRAATVTVTSLGVQRSDNKGQQWFLKLDANGQCIVGKKLDPLH